MFHFIVNPTARSVKRKKIIEKISSAMEKAGEKYKLHFTERRGHAGEYAKELSENGECHIIAVGGDGTLHEVLNGITKMNNVTLGLIPCGTGNDFAAAANIPLNADEAINKILARNVSLVNYIEIGDKRSMNAAGCGMDVDVLRRSYSGKIQGKIKYLLSLLQSVFLFKGYPLEVEVNGERKKHNALFACICNGSQIGGGIKICPAAKIADDKLDLVVVDKLGFFSLIKAFGFLMAGKLLSFKECEHYLCDKVAFIPEQSVEFQLDGELYDGLDFKAEMGSGLKFFL